MSMQYSVPAPKRRDNTASAEDDNLPPDSEARALPPLPQMDMSKRLPPGQRPPPSTKPSVPMLRGASAGALLTGNNPPNPATAELPAPPPPPMASRPPLPLPKNATPFDLNQLHTASGKGGLGAASTGSLNRLPPSNNQHNNNNNNKTGSSNTFEGTSEPEPQYEGIGNFKVALAPNRATAAAEEPAYEGIGDPAAARSMVARLGSPPPVPTPNKPPPVPGQLPPPPPDHLLLSSSSKPPVAPPPVAARPPIAPSSAAYITPTPASPPPLPPSAARPPMALPPVAARSPVLPPSTAYAAPSPAAPAAPLPAPVAESPEVSGYDRLQKAQPEGLYNDLRNDGQSASAPPLPSRVGTIRAPPPAYQKAASVPPPTTTSPLYFDTQPPEYAYAASGPTGENYDEAGYVEHEPLAGRQAAILYESAPPPPVKATAPSNAGTMRRADNKAFARGPPAVEGFDVAPTIPPPRGGQIIGASARRHLLATIFRNKLVAREQQRRSPPSGVLEVTVTSSDPHDKLYFESLPAEVTGETVLARVIARQHLQSFADFFALSYKQDGYDQWMIPELPLSIQIDTRAAVILILRQRLVKMPPVLLLGNERFIHLLFNQYKWFVPRGNIAVTSEALIVRLAALHRHVSNADYDSFALKTCLPPHLSADETQHRYWHLRISRAQQRIKALSTLEAMLQYMLLLRQSVTYGATIFEFGAQGVHPYTALGLAEDGIFLLQLTAASADRRVEFVPFNRVGHLLETSTDLTISVDTKSYSFFESDTLRRAVIIDLFDDYRTLYRVQLNPAFQEQTDVSFLPDVTHFEPPRPREVPDEAFSRAELVKHTYTRLAVAAKLRAPSLVLGASLPGNVATGMLQFYEQLDAAIDGEKADELNFCSLQLNFTELNIVCTALRESIVYVPAPGKTFVENFHWTKLDLSNNPTLAVESTLGVLTKLLQRPSPFKVLNVSRNAWSGSRCEVMLGKLLAGDCTITDLQLNNNNLETHAAISLLAALKSTSCLTSVNLRSCNITDPFFVALGQNMRENRCPITAIDVAHNPITDEGLRAFVAAHEISPVITRLVVSYTKITHVGVKAMFESFGFVRCLSYLSLGNNKLTGKVAESLATLLMSRDCNLTFLNIEGCEIDHKAIEIIVNSLRENKLLKKLVIGHNDLSKSAMKTLSSMLLVNTALKELTLRVSYDIDSKGYKYLWDALAVNVNIQVLDLSNNRMESSDFAGLAQALGQNTILETLVLSSNPALANEKVLAALIDPLLVKPCVTLRRLDLSVCGFTDKHAAKLTELMRRAGSIQQLCLRANKFGITGINNLLRGVTLAPMISHLDLLGHVVHKDSEFIDLYDRAVASVLRTVLVDGMNGS
ncbi:hypothetical protein CAOG_08104 [Capsaspora owczarzaki ATCC 30864]|uniref:FERM domain-containing protein n=1 Tax=Capsaspora owczarzaki (strain ATCC 30864) TaxID=595528 RepID=A0A0D2UT03_CAPO3|nr:hypothetical protein CAOG_08104 [Capsaspora owczarzaki ATCC 30864]KJE98076.1 hypothetical protein, variant 1 [Capsaspora owczarzaki ATCC 30864]|eukprot:XP_004342705.2 hypothetical protein CAOG_08104 [Capsaspora owczarzaki ATCC 30864]